jgi:hypothetical protein
MTLKGEIPTPSPIGDADSTARNQLLDDPEQESTEHSTEESTEEWNVDAMGEEFIEVDTVSRSEASGRAIVATVIDDRSTGAATPIERAARRARRDTIPSVVPSMLAKSMRPAGMPLPGRPPGPPPGRPTSSIAGALSSALASTPVRDPAAPAPAHADVTRKVVDAEVGAIPSERHSAAYSIEMIAHATGDVHTAPTAEQQIPSLAGPVAALVKKACFCLEAGDVAEAVLAAAAAIEANGDSSNSNEVGDLTDTASGPLARIFTAGPISKVPVVNRSDADLDTLALDELHWALMRRLDGQLTFDQVFRATKIPAIDALKIAAGLLRDGLIRVDDRARS